MRMKLYPRADGAGLATSHDRQLKIRGWPKIAFMGWFGAGCVSVTSICACLILEDLGVKGCLNLFQAIVAVTVADEHRFTRHGPASTGLSKSSGVNTAHLNRAWTT